MNKTLKQYQNFVQNFIQLHEDAETLPLGEHIETEVKEQNNKVIIFAPHPDDEAIIGGIPLRLQDEGFEVINFAVTLGSNITRKEGRKKELEKACKSLGFRLEIPNKLGLDDVKPSCREQNLTLWKQNVSFVISSLKKHNPKIILLPHDNDFNSTHIGSHFLVKDALMSLNKDPEFIQPIIIETEFWHMMNKPNLMVEITSEQEALLIYAISAHTEEVQRNPYHLKHPGRMADNTMRGSEVVGGQGNEAKKMHFAMIANVVKLIKNDFNNALDSGLCIDSKTPIYQALKKSLTKN